MRSAEPRAGESPAATPRRGATPFGKYTLLKPIGTGGMASVWLARLHGAAGFEREVVVKRILPSLADEPDFVARFVREAQLCARMSHANVVQVLDFGEVEGEYFMALEYVNGRDLRAVMKTLALTSGPLPVGLSVFVACEVARALAYAHALRGDDGQPLGLVHRDVSPSNVMLGYDGSVKLLDFGIARAYDQGERSKTGTLKGKTGYLAPEQLTAHSKLDGRSDQFALGVVLHEALSGQRLFRGANDLETLERIRECQVDPPSRTNPAVPADLDEVVLTMLARDRDRRFASCAEIVKRLETIAHRERCGVDELSALLQRILPADAAVPGAPDNEPATDADPTSVEKWGTARPAPRRRLRAALLAGGALLLGAGVLWAIYGRGPSPVAAAPSAPASTAVAAPASAGSAPAVAAPAAPSAAGPSPGSAAVAAPGSASATAPSPGPSPGSAAVAAPASAGPAAVPAPASTGSAPAPRATTVANPPAAKRAREEKRRPKAKSPDLDSGGILDSW